MLREMTVSAIVQYIEDNLENRLLSTEDLVVYSGYSRRYLQETFKEYLGIPIGKYIRVRRASRAAALLKLTKISIIEISDRLFYDSQQTFTREFKKIMGYTPGQYRNSSFWSFYNLLGRRGINGEYLAPKLCSLEEIASYGKSFDYTELILYTGVDTKNRWGKVYGYLEKCDRLTVSSKIPFNDKGSNITARTIVWTNEEHADYDFVIDKGLYAQFSFSGTLDEYMVYMYNIYYNSLPIHKLNKRDAYDIEIITKGGNGVLHYHCFLPVYCDNVYDIETVNKEKLHEIGMTLYHRT
ncbi:TPA: helix-turn-helix domain-containing protein [Escherichia coli]|nr:helix-turn-helix domain-containing protein [Escherichia coli]HBA8543846.1 helix-turn-helix domain-containing protein [Escherichia coli]HBB0103356.1 helix-turn-helix domain-containing protein [Escherichia coli]